MSSDTSSGFIVSGFITAFWFSSALTHAQSPPPAAMEKPGNVLPPHQILPEILDRSKIGPSVIEHMDEVIVRDLAMRKQGPRRRGGRNGAQGTWVVPSRGGTYYPKSGRHYITNKWGDTSMGIGFPTPTDVHGVYVAGQAGAGVWTIGLRVIGYREGIEIGHTDWFKQIGKVPAWLEINLIGADRIVFQSRAVHDGGGWYALDDLTFSPQPLGNEASQKIVLDFEDCKFRQVLTGSDFAGLIWETGTGNFKGGQIIHAPLAPQMEEKGAPAKANDTLKAAAGTATAPLLNFDYQGVIFGDAGSFFIPPDTCGAIGPDHFVEVVNGNFAVYDRSTGLELVNVSLGAFLPGSGGDPRILWDQHHNRWIILVSDFESRIFFAYSLSADPTASWFKTSILVSVGADTGCFPDYQTLGVDANGIYSGALMAGCSSMSIFTIEKAPLLDPTPSMGTVTAFRGFPFEGAIQAVKTFGDSAGEYLISRDSSSTFRLRQITGPLTSPTLNDLGTISIPTHSSPPDAPALGSTTPINTIDPRPLNALYRNGSIWVTHDVMSSFGTASCRWYQIDPITKTIIQSGTVEDPSLHYYYGSIAVNADGDVVMGFSGSNASQFVACYFTGRLASDPVGTMATPVLFRTGDASYTITDGVGRNRWGDYSLTTVDPLTDRTFYTIQEYVHSTDQWGTWIAELSFCASPPPVDCNANCVLDSEDIATGTSQDCNLNGIPDSCDVALGTSEDCNFNGIPDTCEDCNGNGIADECDLSTNYSENSGILSPLGAGSDANFIFVAPPLRTSDVTFDFTASADLDTIFTSVEVFLNTVLIGEIFITDASTCADPPDEEQIILTQSLFDSIVGTGDADVLMTAFIDPGACGGASFITVNMSYGSPSLFDLNGNGIIDSCECPADCAGTPDGSVNVTDLLALLANWGGTPTLCDIAPPGGDGSVNVTDLLALLAAWGSCAAP
ncbi:MAG: hypothetical protein IID30_04090 [Planctomycetes bacterium]|nr:hypothetical protein [Planctomycetota bacterium]